MRLWVGVLIASVVACGAFGSGGTDDDDDEKPTPPAASSSGTAVDASASSATDASGATIDANAPNTECDDFTIGGKATRTPASGSNAPKRVDGTGWVFGLGLIEPRHIDRTFTAAGPIDHAKVEVTLKVTVTDDLLPSDSLIDLLTQISGTPKDAPRVNLRYSPRATSSFFLSGPDGKSTDAPVPIQIASPYEGTLTLDTDYKGGAAGTVRLDVGSSATTIPKGVLSASSDLVVRVGGLLETGVTGAITAKVDIEVKKICVAFTLAQL